MRVVEDKEGKRGSSYLGTTPKRLHGGVPMKHKCWDRVGLT